MSRPDRAVTSTRVMVGDTIRPARVEIADGHVTAVVDPAIPAAAGVDVHDVGDLVVLPGLVDSHVHVNEPGRTHWEGFATATRAAAAGGVTTIVDMPLNCLPPTVDVAALDTKRAVAADQVVVDTAFWGGAVPGNDDDLAGLHEAGVRGFKSFLCDSGVPEYGCVHPSALDPLLGRIATLGSMLVVHAEDPDTCDAAAAALHAPTASERRRHATWLATRPARAEARAVEALAAACRRTGARVHVLHLSAAAAGEVVAAARDEGLPITAETCPHYLTLHAEDVPDGATEFKCAPPIRDRANADRLWDLLVDGVLEAVVSDHSPCPPADKAPGSGDFLAAWGGIASLQLGLPLVWTAARRRGVPLELVVRRMSTGPARIAGLARKGSLEPGAAADLVAFDPDVTWEVDGTRLHHRHPVTPHHGRTLTGRAVHTWLAGRPIMRDGVVDEVATGVLR